MGQVLRCGARDLSLDQPRVMGVLNITPDSFSDGGRYSTLDSARRRANEMVDEGASIIDVGAESTRPGAKPVSVGEEMDRLLPVVESLVNELDAVISVDTSKPEVMEICATMGVGLINDVNALESPGALSVVEASGLPVCLMHKKGSPEMMQENPQYVSVVTEVSQYLERRLEQCHAAGIDRSRIILDPGFGFGKTLQHNYALFNGLPELGKLGIPLLVGVSRKSMIGALLDLPPSDRVLPSVVLAAMAVERGASILRVHDVRETVQALRLVQAVAEPGSVHLSAS
ncbi:MAG: dihydropteroate synthase [bacterium]